jgi:hypothetical protein
MVCGVSRACSVVIGLVVVCFQMVEVHLISHERLGCSSTYIKYRLLGLIVYILLGARKIVVCLRTCLYLVLDVDV